MTSTLSNGMAESFVKTLKRDYAKSANKPNSKTVTAQLQSWFDGYNSYHALGSLGNLPQTKFREKIGKLNIPSVLKYRGNTNS